MEEFDLYIGLKVRAGRGLPFELRFAEACGCPALISSYGSGDSADTSPNTITIETSNKSDAALSASIVGRFLERFGAGTRLSAVEERDPPPNTVAESEFIQQFRILLNSQLNSPANLVRARKAIRQAQNELCSRPLADSLSFGLNSKYRELVHNILTKDQLN